MTTPSSSSHGSTAPAQSDEFSAIVIADISCRSCGYNLRTLAIDGVCPECATLISTSMRSDLLREADPDWLQRLYIGCRLVGLGVWGILMSIVVLRDLLHRFQLMGVGISAVAAAAGVWMLTEADPSGMGERRYGWLRNCGRWMAIAALAATLLGYSLEFAVWTVHISLQCLIGAIYTVWGIIFLIYLDRLGERTNRRKRRLSFRWTLVSFLVLSGFGFAATLAPVAGLLSTFGFGAPMAWANLLIVYGEILELMGVLKNELSAAGQKDLRLWRKFGLLLSRRT